MKILLLLPLLCISFIGFAQSSNLNLASDIWPPFSNVEGEKSIASDLVDEALKRQRITTTTEMVVFDDLINGIRNGKYDGSAALWKSEEREKELLFSEPYLNNQLILVGLKGSNVEANSFRELTGKKLGIVLNYAYGDINSRQNIILVTGSGNQQNLERLLSGDIDFMLVDALIIQYLLKYQLNDVTEHLAIGEKPLLIKSLHFAIDKNTPNGSEIIENFNKEIKNMILDGTYHEILELNWIKMDIDGDGSLEFVLDGNKAGTKSPTNTYNLMMTDYSEEVAATPKKYFIDGKLYEDWEAIPKTYKLDYSVNHQPNEGDYMIRFGF